MINYFLVLVTGVRIEVRNSNVCEAKVTIKLFLCFYFNRAPRHEGVFGGWSVAPHIIVSTLGGGQWSASHPSGFTLG
jgi:hypothetical protein